MEIKIRFKRTKAKDYGSVIEEFKTDQEFNTWLMAQYKDETYRKILDYKQVN